MHSLEFDRQESIVLREYLGTRNSSQCVIVKHAKTTLIVWLVFIFNTHQISIAGYYWRMNDVYFTSAQPFFLFIYIYKTYI